MISVLTLFKLKIYDQNLFLLINKCISLLFCLITTKGTNLNMPYTAIWFAQDKNYARLKLVTIPTLSEIQTFKQYAFHRFHGPKPFSHAAIKTLNPGPPI